MVNMPGTKSSVYFNIFIALAAGWVLSVITNDIPYISNYLKDTITIKTLSSGTIWISHHLLGLFNLENTVTNNNVIKITGTNGVLIAYSCLGIRHIMHFTGFMAVIKGYWKNKIWFIPAGIIIILFVNIIRIVIVAFVQKNYPDLLESIHFYLGRIMIYGSILSLWIIWFVKFSKQKT